MGVYDGPAPTIPDWLLLNSGKPSAEELNKLRAPREAVYGPNTPIPILYGRERVAGKPFYAIVDAANGYLYVGYLLCEGECDAIEGVLIDGTDVLDSFILKPGAAINRHLGVAGDGPDELLRECNAAVGLDTYNDTLPGLCYITVRCPANSTSGFPRLEAIVRGRKLYDPRKDSTNGGAGAHRLDNRATWQWSDNPTLAFADFSTQLAGWGVKWDSVAINANANDQLMSDGQKKRSVGLLLEAQASASEWAQGFRVYMGAYLAREDGKIRIVPDRADVDPDSSGFAAAMASDDVAAWNAVGVAYHFKVDDIKADTLAVKHRSKRNSPNSMIIDYTDGKLVAGWRTESVQKDSPTIAAGAPRRNSKVSLPGIQNKSQAYREAVERLNWFLSDLEGSFTAWDEGLYVQNGSIIAITHPIGLSARLFRVVSVAAQDGRWSYNITEYDKDQYSVEVMPPDEYEDLPTGDPTDVPAITNLVASEELYAYKDGIMRSRVRAAWDPVKSPYFSHYFVEVWRGTTLLWQTTTQQAVAVSDSLEEVVGDAQVTVTVKVAAAFNLVVGPYSNKDVLIRGKVDPPPAITALTTTSLIFGIKIDWEFPFGLRRVLKTELWHSEDNSIDNATLLSDLPFPQNTYTMTGLQSGKEFFFWVRLVDDVGNVSQWYPGTEAGAGIGLRGRASTDANIILDYLTGKLTESQLGEALLGKIESIDNLIPLLWDPDAEYSKDQTVIKDGIIYSWIPAAAGNEEPPSDKWMNVGQAVAEAGAVAGIVQQLQLEITELDGKVTAQGTKVDGMFVQLKTYGAGDRNWGAGDRTVYAGVKTVYTVIAETDKAMAQRVDTVEASITAQGEEFGEGLTQLGASVQTTATALATLDGKASAMQTTKVQVTANGIPYTAGFAIGIDYSGGTISSTFAVNADTFMILNGTGPSAALTSPFAVAGGQVYIRSAVIQDASITNAKIGGVIQSVALGVGGNPLWKLDKNGYLTMTGPNNGGWLQIIGNLLEVFDANGTRRIRLGIW